MPFMNFTSTYKYSSLSASLVFYCGIQISIQHVHQWSGNDIPYKPDVPCLDRHGRACWETSRIVQPLRCSLEHFPFTESLKWDADLVRIYEKLHKALGDFGLRIMLNRSPDFQATDDQETTLKKNIKYNLDPLRMHMIPVSLVVWGNIGASYKNRFKPMKTSSTTTTKPEGATTFRTSKLLRLCLMLIQTSGLTENFAQVETLNPSPKATC